MASYTARVRVKKRYPEILNGTRGRVRFVRAVRPGICESDPGPEADKESGRRLYPPREDIRAGAWRGSDGRPGPLNAIHGRDHWAAVRAARSREAELSTQGGSSAPPMSRRPRSLSSIGTRNRPIFPEDVPATIYSVLGIDWTKSLSGTPSGRDFAYVEPTSGTNFIGSTEVSELFHMSSSKSMLSRVIFAPAGPRRTSGTDGRCFPNLRNGSGFKRIGHRWRRRSCYPTETGFTRTAETGIDGVYRLPELPIGPYKLEATQQAFGTYVQTGIVLQVNINPTINISLQVGTAMQAVQVEANRGDGRNAEHAVGTVFENNGYWICRSMAARKPR